MMSPSNESELADAIRQAEGPLVVQGGGTRPIGRPVDGTVLSVTGMSGITLYEPGALTLVAQAGTPVARIEEVLASEGQRLPFEPMDHRNLLGTTGVPTIGGVVGGNVSGPRRVQAGACRDSLIGVRFVDGRGTILKNGGRVMKNVTGYDLVKLMAGSQGTLGVMSEVSFKVLPVPEMAATLSISGLDATTAVQAMSSALGSPFEVSAAAHLPAGPEGPSGTMLRIEGFEASVSYRTDRLRKVLGRFGDLVAETDQARVSADWQSVRDVAPFVDRPGAVWRVSVKPSDGPAVAAAIPDAEVLFDWGGGLVWLLVKEAVDVRAAMDGIAGHATLVRASRARRAEGRVFPPQSAPLAGIAEGLRARFDPRGLLNPGRMT